MCTVTSSRRTLASVAGKPCVAVADPLPVGAPDVPVDVGPPPAQLVTKDLKEGVAIGTKSLDAGAAAAKLKQLVAVSNG